MKFFTPSKFALLFAFVFAFTGASSAQKPTATPPADDGEVIKVDSRLVVVPVSVTTPAGDPVAGLTEKDFRIREEGKQQAIEKVGTADSVPLEIAVLFDVSASTDAMFKFEQETAAKFLRDVLRPEDRATVFSVGERPVVLQSRNTAEKSIEAVKSIQPTKQQTAFFDTVAAAANYLRTNTPAGRRKVIVIISDGDDTNSSGIIKAIWDAERNIADNVQGAALRELRVKARDAAKAKEQLKVLKALQDADAVLFSINPGGSSYQLNKLSVFGQENMQKFADDTGGTAFLPKFLPVDTPDAMQNSGNMRKNTEVLDRIFNQLANELRAQYLVQYYSEAEYPINRFVKLDVALENPIGRKLRARRGYYVKN